MPPLPYTAQTLTTRLNNLSESNKSILQLIQRLSKLDFQPGSTPLDTEEGDARLELSAEIHETLKQLEEDLELLSQEVEDIIQSGTSSGKRRDSAKESERSRLAVLLARLKEDLKSSRAQYRRAQLTAKRNADRAKVKERELLFSNLQSGTSTPSSIRRSRNANSSLTENEIVGQASSDVTLALRRTQQLMQSELSRSRFAQETLEQSTAALADLGEKYTDLNTLLGKSRELVGTLLKSQKSDTWYLETTLYLLITTVIWLAFRRWFYGPITWFIIWPLKLLFRVLFAVVPASAAAASSSSLSAAGSPSSSLIVQPSATGGIPKRPVGANVPPAYVPVGGGGRGRDAPLPPHQQQSLSEKIGKMAEQSQQAEHSQQGQQKEDEPVIRGDGERLQESNQKRNPKKKMWVEGSEEAEREKQKAEEAQKQAQEHKNKDEL